MSDKDEVKARYPQAFAERVPAVYEQGQANPYQEEYWVILPQNAMGVAPLGQGATEAEAWADAAMKPHPPITDTPEPASMPPGEQTAVDDLLKASGGDPLTQEG